MFARLQDALAKVEKLYNQLRNKGDIFLNATQLKKFEFFTDNFLEPLNQFFNTKFDFNL